MTAAGRLLDRTQASQALLRETGKKERELVIRTRKLVNWVKEVMSDTLDGAPGPRMGGSWQSRKGRTSGSRFPGP